MIHSVFPKCIIDIFDCNASNVVTRNICSSGIPSAPARIEGFTIHAGHGALRSAPLFHAATSAFITFSASFRSSGIINVCGQNGASPLIAWGRSRSDICMHAANRVLVHEAYIPGIRDTHAFDCDDVIRRAHVSRSRGLPHREVTDGFSVAEGGFSTGLFTHILNAFRQRFSGNDEIYVVLPALSVINKLEPLPGERALSEATVAARQRKYGDKAPAQRDHASREQRHRPRVETLRCSSFRSVCGGGGHRIYTPSITRASVASTCPPSITCAKPREERESARKRICMSKKGWMLPAFY